MTEKRFELGKSENQDTIFDNEGPDDYYHLGNDTEDVKALCKLLNELHEENQLNKLQEENKQLKKIIKENTKTINQSSEENQQLNKILKIIADAESFRVENSVKEILRNNLFGLDTVAGESFNAYKDYTLLNNFFKEHYGEHWDNDKYD